MAEYRPARSGVLETMEDFVKRREREVANFGREAEAATHRACGDARRNQNEAYNQFGDRYRVDHFLPREVGAVVAYPFGQIGYHEFLANDPT